MPMGVMGAGAPVPAGPTPVYSSQFNPALVQQKLERRQIALQNMHNRGRR
jgi:hypothetical protein